MSHLNHQFKIRLKPDVKAWLESRSHSDERSQTWLINHYLKEAMQREQKTAAQ